MKTPPVRVYVCNRQVLASEDEDELKMEVEWRMDGEQNSCKAFKEIESIFNRNQLKN